MTSITEELQRRLEGVAEYAGQLVDGSEEWHAYRAQGIGASEIGAVMGIEGAFKSSIQLWAERSGLAQEPPVDERSQERFYWGHASEPMIAQRFAEGHSEFEVEDTGTWRHLTRRYQIVNPDRLLRNRENGEISLLEIKTSGTGYGWGGGQVPKYYLAQVRYQLSCLGLRYGFIAVKIGNDEYREYRIPLDATQPIQNMADGSMYYENEISEDIIIACTEGFLRCVEAGVAPQIDGSVSAWNTVRTINPERVDGSRYTITEERALDLLEAKREHESAEARFRRAKSTLLQDAGVAHRIYYTDKNGNEVQVARRDKAPRGNGYIIKILGK